MGIQIGKKWMVEFLFVIYLLLTFDVFTRLPIPFLYEFSYFSFKAILLVFFLFYMVQSIKKRQINKLFFILLPIIIIPFISALKANQIYGQSFWLGMSAERSKIDFVIPILLVFLIERGSLSLGRVEKLVVNMSIIYLLVMLFVNLFVNPEVFANTNLVLSSQDKGVILKFSYYLVVFSFFYGYVKVLNERKFKYLAVIASSLFIFVVFAKARYLTVSILFCALSHLIYLPFKKKVYFAVFGVIFVLMLILITTVFFPKEFATVVELFISAFNVVLGGEVMDNSAASRITQSEIAWQGIKEHPIFGTGLLSNRHNEGYLGMYNYFFPSDIGWLGSLFLYGIFGLLILKIPMILGIIYRYPRHLKNNTFLVSMRLFLLFFFIHSIVASYDVNKIGMFLFVFGILYCYRYQLNPNELVCNESYIFDGKR